MLFDIKNSKTSPDDIADAIESLDSYRNSLKDIVENNNYDVDEASINLPSDNIVYEEVEKVANEVSSLKLKYIFVIGIGGSRHGTKAVYDALLGHFDMYDTLRFPKLYILSTNDTKSIQKAISFIGKVEDQDEILINIISKSGGTTETIANAEIILREIISKFGETSLDRVVVTSNNNSELTKVSKKKNIKTISIPEKVGGRFSVLSAVGLLPLLCCGIDIESMLQGARDMRTKCLEDNISKNYGLQSAIVLYLQRKIGKTIHTTFTFHPELESLGLWYRQLLGESIGKKLDDNENVVQVGITPEVAVGSTDLHSVGQLYLGGPKDKVTTFISANKIGGVVSVPDDRVFASIVPSATSKTAEDIMNAIYEGTKVAYINNELPFMEAIMEEISPYEIGQFLQFKMFEVMYLGKLLNINTFNQPSVEDYKIETRKLLENN